MDAFAGKEGDILKNLATSSKGLTAQEAAARLQKYGRNELAQKERISKWVIFIEQFNNFLVYILLGAIAVSAFLGISQWGTQESFNYFSDAIVILLIVILNAILGFVQEYRAESSLEALKAMLNPQAKVLRDGKQLTIDARFLVPGDIMLIEAGDKLPADGRILSQIGLKVQEASLTGESTAVGKRMAVLPPGTILADRVNMVFSGTTAVVGKASVIVTATGMQTELGKIAHLIAEAKSEPTPLQKRLESLGKTLGIITIGICVLVFIIAGLRSHDWLGMFLVAVSLAVAAVPEGLPAVITISLALGMQRMIKRHALIRKLHSVEALGSTTIICSDKTGTLTKNEMTVRKTFANGAIQEVQGAGYAPQPAFKPIEPMLMQIGMRCNNAALEADKGDWKVIGDPTEAALLVSGLKAGCKLDQPERIHEILFDSARKRMTTIHKEGGKKIAYTKGAPTIVLDRCAKILVKGKVRALTAKDRKEILAANDSMAAEALRVLAFAYRDVTSLKDLDKAEQDLIFVGLQGMIDPPRPEAKEAIARCKDAGIKVVMITGDYIGTAKAVAQELGITGEAVTGEELDKMDLDGRIAGIGIFARVNPEHKMRIVQALKKRGEIVAMTGDGVNDAPALKNADIGIAMGISGTDVAKESSAMVLTDDNFASIVSAIEEGRAIYDNIRKFVFFLLAANIGEVLILFLALLIDFRLPGGAIAIPLIAIQLLWINLVTDGIPALALGVDRSDPQIMRRKPRPSTEQIITKDLIANIIIVGIVMTALALLLFNMFLPQGIGIAQSVVMSFVVLFEIGVVAMLTRHYFGTPLRSNPWFYLAIGISMLLQLAVMYSPLAPIFKLAPLGLEHWTIIVGVCVFASLILVITTEIVKRWAHSTLLK